MRLETIKKLCCPFDKADLGLTVITKDIHENVIEGFLLCNECKRIYPIVKSIPIMSPDEYREFKLEQPLLDRWKKHFKGKSFEDFRLVGQESKGIEAISSPQ
jgi:uncharacterized protein YbaR (Trm112 family)